MNDIPQTWGHEPQEQQAQPVESHRERLFYDGDLGHITKLWLVNLGLFIVTLSFYRFWGRTRVRQYIWSHTSILGSRLEYSGTGKELMIGFLVTIPFLLIVSVLSEVFVILGLIGTIIFFLFGFAAVYFGLKYRVSRTHWRAIKGNMPSDGYSGYCQLAFYRSFIDTLTFGIRIPKSTMLKWQYLVQHMSLGNVPFEFHMNLKGLQKRHILTGSLGTIIATIVFSMVSALLFSSNTGVTANPEDILSTAMIVKSVVGIIIFYLVFFIIRQFYVAKLVERKISGISIGSMRFYTFFTTGQFVTFKLVNALILIATLGLGSAFILHRKAQFFATYTATEGVLDETIIAQLQEQSATSTIGEGFLDSFGYDLAFLS